MRFTLTLLHADVLPGILFLVRMPAHATDGMEYLLLNTGRLPSAAHTLPTESKPSQILLTWGCFGLWRQRLADCGCARARLCTASNVSLLASTLPSCMSEARLCPDAVRFLGVGVDLTACAAKSAQGGTQKSLYLVSLGSVTTITGLPKPKVCRQHHSATDMLVYHSRASLLRLTFPDNIMH